LVALIGAVLLRLRSALQVREGIIDFMQRYDLEFLPRLRTFSERAPSGADKQWWVRLSGIRE